MVTLDTAFTLASDMLDAGKPDACPHTALKLALWAAVLSANNSIDRNGLQLNELRPYVYRLPWQCEAIADIVARSGYDATPTQIKAILLIDIAWTCGDLWELSHKPDCGRAWVLWRRQVCRLFGLAYKTASMAALLMWPFDSPFAVIDRHVCARLDSISGYPALRWYTIGFNKDRPYGYKRYRMLERYLWRELRDTLGRGAVNLALYHWYKWEEYRQLHAYRYSEIGNSHVLLCVYAW